MDNGQNIISDLLMFSLSANDWTEFKQLRKKVSDVESSLGGHSRVDRLEGRQSNSNSPTRDNQSTGDYNVTHIHTEGSEMPKDKANMTKFTIDTQSPFVKQTVVPNPAMQ